MWHISVCFCANVHVSMCEYMQVVSTRVCVVCMRVSECAYVCAQMHLHICARVCVCVCVCACVRVHA